MLLYASADRKVTGLGRCLPSAERLEASLVNRMIMRTVVLSLILLAAPVIGRAEELIPADRPVEAAVDHYIDARLAQENIAAAGPADDANFIRRVTLDLAGRVPTSSEVESYLHATDPDKRAQLVDRLVASPDFAFQQRNEFDLWLMAGMRVRGGATDWNEWLLKAMQEHRSWPQLFREVMLAREGDAEQKGALTFLKSRATNVDDLTNDTSKLFFGVSINCAKCHDHPLVADWTQDHYYGLTSFFSRTYMTRKNFLAEREDGGEVKFRTTAGVEKKGQLMFLTGAVITEPADERTDDEKKAAQERQKADQQRETPPDPPAYSRRAKLVEVVLETEAGGFFPRSFVNRIWARLMGTGLVTPLDQMHSENPPSHPELMAWLARDVQASGYDLKRLMRGIVLSRAYGRTSRWEAPGARPSERLFAVAGVRPLTPMQLALSLAVATSNPAEISERAASEDWAKRRRELEGQAQGFAPQLEIPGENFQVGVGEALLFSNGAAIEKEFLRDGDDRLVGALRKISDPSHRIHTAFVALASRPPSVEEVEAVSAYLAQREDRSVSALQQALWAIVTSGEFRFNY